MRDPITAGQSYVDGQWTVRWAEAPVTVGNITVHEVVALVRKRLVFKDRIRHVNFLHADKPWIAEKQILHTVQAVTRNGLQPRIIEGPHGTVTDVFADGTDGSIRSDSSASAAEARGGNSEDLNPFGTSVLTWGWFSNGSNDFQFHQPFIKFDTSGLPDTDTISAASVFLDLQTSYDATTDLYQLRKTTDWATLEAADFIPGDTFAGLTLLSEVDYDNVQGSGYTEFAITNPDTNINKTGTTYIVGGTKFFADNTAVPTADAGWDWEPTEATGTGSDPKMTITHAAGGASVKRYTLTTLGCG